MRFPNNRHASAANRRGGYRTGDYAQRASDSPPHVGLQIVVGIVILTGVTMFATPMGRNAWRSATMTPDQITARERSVYYARCDDARAAGVAPIYRGQPGYREGMDGDNDGIACEPYR